MNIAQSRRTSRSVGVSPTLQKTYTWGIDLSVSKQGPGGVSGLLATTVGTSGSLVRYLHTYDGTGNVSKYLDSTGIIAAHYDYDPFGRETVSTGPKTNDFAHRVSPKPLDSATRLYHYAYRYDDPVTGRWPSRDPIEEKGGINLYGFVGNDGVNWWDVLGLIWFHCPGCDSIWVDEPVEFIPSPPTNPNLPRRPTFPPSAPPMPTPPFIPDPPEMPEFPDSPPSPPPSLDFDLDDDFGEGWDECEETYQDWHRRQGRNGPIT